MDLRGTWDSRCDPLERRTPAVAVPQVKAVFQDWTVGWYVLTYPQGRHPSSLVPGLDVHWRLRSSKGKPCSDLAQDG